MSSLVPVIMRRALVILFTEKIVPIFRNPILYAIPPIVSPFLTIYSVYFTSLIVSGNEILLISFASLCGMAISLKNFSTFSSFSNLILFKKDELFCISLYKKFIVIKDAKKTKKIIKKYRKIEIYFLFRVMWVFLFMVMLSSNKDGSRELIYAEISSLFTCVAFFLIFKNSR